MDEKKRNIFQSMKDGEGKDVPAKQEVPKSLAIFAPESNDLEQTALTNLQSASKIAQEAATELSDLARESQHPRAYDSLANMLKILVDTNKTILDKASVKKDADDLSPDAPPVTKNETHVHFASVKDMENFMKKGNKKSEEEE